MNHGTERKKKIIVNHLGEDWQEKYPNKSIDAVYRIATKDDRASVFFKIDAIRKQKLHTMMEFYDTTTGDLIGVMIDAYYQEYIERKDSIMKGLACDYAGNN